MEQCWHPVPGGTAVAAVEIARRLVDRPDVRLLGVAGFHRRPPAAPFRPPMAVGQLLWPRPALYESWLRRGRPAVERVTGPVDVAHATGLVPCPSAAPLVVTVHDLAFLHEPGRFTRQGHRVMARSLDRIRDDARLVITSSAASRRDLVAAGIPDARVRVVPLGVDATPAPPADVERVRRRHRLPERFVLFVGTLEPRKNLRRLVAAAAETGAGGGAGLPLVVAGPPGWGDAAPAGAPDVRFLGFVPAADLPGLYAAASVFAYPSELEGFGLPVAEAMAQGTPVVTSAGRSTEEVAGGAAVLVDPLDVASIAAGLREALDRRTELGPAGRARAAELTWERAADLTLTAYREAAGDGSGRARSRIRDGGRPETIPAQMGGAG
jgi:glycosyltransferase involved in cell wall biosynthesis